LINRYLISVIPALLFVLLFGSVVVAPYGFAQGPRWLTPSAPVVSWTAASNYVGETVAVEGVILYTYSSYSGTTFLDFHTNGNTNRNQIEVGRTYSFDFPYPGYFSGAVFSSDTGNFKCSISNFYLNKDVRITGMVQLFKGAPEIIISNPSQIEVAYQGFPCS